MTNTKQITVVGGGLVGSLLSAILANKGYQVDLFEARPDPRAADQYQGRSINLALSDRGWLALQSVGVDEQIREQAIPMYCRVMHDLQGNITRQPYGKENQAIWSVSRAGINQQLLNIAEQQANCKLHFEHQLTDLDFASGKTIFSHKSMELGHSSDLIFGADGTFSKVRRLAQELPRQRTSYNLDYMPQSYMELSIAPNPDGSHKLEKNALHIWPRTDFMLIALPNPDGSFTCTLFLDHEGEVSFAALDSEQKISDFMHHNFKDAMPLLEDPINAIMQKQPSALCLVHIFPWIFNQRVALIGDSAHAMVPFYGQGMNCGFEDCRVLSELIDQHDHQWDMILSAYQAERKPNGDAIIELARRNFVEMSDLAGDADFLLRKKIEARFHDMYPDLWIPLYSMVTFSPHIPYSQALQVGDIQTEIMDQIMALPNIHSEWQQDHVYQRLHELARERFGEAV